MKTITKAITALSMSMSLFSTTQAAPHRKGGLFKSTSQVERISSMKPGDPYVLVCNDYKTSFMGETIPCDGYENRVVIKRIDPHVNHNTSIAKVSNAWR